MTMVGGKQTKSLWGIGVLNKLDNWPLKVAIAIFLMCLAFRLVCYQSATLETNLDDPSGESVKKSESESEAAQLPSPPPQYVDISNLQNASGEIMALSPPPLVDKTDPSQSEDAQSSPDDHVKEADGGNSTEESDSGKCDVFVGDWIPNPSGPMYTNSSCPLIEAPQNCMRNGRTDSEFLYWKWNPRNCELPPFDPQRFLESMRNKAWALIGDSISRNHAQSLLCMLSTVEQPKEVYRDEHHKSKRWHFSSFNFSLSNIWSPFLLKAAIFEDDNGISSAPAQLHFDKLDTKWADLYPNLDYVVISSGQWFLKAAIYYENDTEVGCHICPGRNLTETGFAYAYQRALNRVLSFVSASKHRGTTFFRMATPDHFEGGEWHNGGTCPKQSPAKTGEIEIKDLHHYLRDAELEEFVKASAKAEENGVKLKLLDFTNLLLTRPDGHPGAYREFQPFASGKNSTIRDCLHWCLPGPIDYLNDVIMQQIDDG